MEQPLRLYFHVCLRVVYLRPHTSCDDEIPMCSAAVKLEESVRATSEQKLSKRVMLVICPVNDRRESLFCCLFSSTHIPWRNGWLRYTREKTWKPKIDVYRSPCLTTNTFQAVASPSNSVLSKVTLILTETNNSACQEEHARSMLFFLPC